MRRVAGQMQIPPCGTRLVTGVSPVLYFPPSEPQLPRDKQIEKNTLVAVELIKRIKGPQPSPYTRKYKLTIEEIEKDVENLLGGAAKLRRPIPDDAPMDKITLMERCLRHALWSYHKEEGRHNFEEYRKWLVYTADDEEQLAHLRRDVELTEKFRIFKERRVASGDTSAIPYPQVDWASEWNAAVDREVVAERRFRYDTLAINTTDRDEKAIGALQESYRRALQEKRLDDLAQMLERFKPVLAREAIMQRLTIKHLEGQLGVWRYLDWTPEVRDRCELESDNHFHYWVMQFEEKRMQNVRLRSRNEVTEVMAKAQIAAIQSDATEAAKPSGDGVRDQLLKEVLALQTKLAQRDDGKTKESSPSGPAQ